MQNEPSLAASASEAGASSLAALDASLLRDQKTENSMSRLSAKVNSDRAKGEVSRAVYTGYLKACGMFVVSLALAISMLAQVGKLLYDQEVWWAYHWSFDVGHSRVARARDALAIGLPALGLSCGGGPRTSVSPPGQNSNNSAEP